MNNCLFCKIINGDIPSNKVYEDEKIFVFLDINPNSNGHMLIIPKEHLVTVLDVSEKLISHILCVIKEKLYIILKEKLNIDGLTISQNNFLGQEVKHYHIHLIPRYNKENVLYQKRDVSEIYNMLMN